MSIIQVNTIRSRSGASAPEFDQGINVTGIATLGAGSSSQPGVRISNGIVTATAGVVTYYGDGRYLQNAGVAVTYIPNNLNIVGVTTITPQLHVGTGVTINTQGLLVTGIVTASSYRGSGSALTGIVTTLSAGSDILIVSSGSTTGTGIVTVSVNQTSLFTNKAVFTPTATGIATTSRVSIGTTIATDTLTISGTIGASGTVTAPNFQGVASTSTTVNVVSTGSSGQIHYLNFSNVTGGNTQVRADSDLSYYPSTGILSTSNLNISGITTTLQLQVGNEGSSIIATGIGSIGIKNQYPRYPLEVGGLGATGVTQYINGDLQTTQHINVGGGANITGVVTANNFVGNGFGLVGVGSTVQTYYTEITSSTTWVLPDYLNWVFVQCVGGGGSGNVRATGSGGPGGGGAGGVAERLYRVNAWRAVGISSFQVFVGTGGATSSTATGNAGGLSKFEVTATDYLLAGGGGAAVNSVGGAGGDGITGAATSSYASAGGASGSGNGRNSVIGPGSGAAQNGFVGGVSITKGSSGPAGMGTGGNGGNGTTVIATAGGFPGGGGGGSTAGNSGAGGNGCVRIWGW